MNDVLAFDPFEGDFGEPGDVTFRDAMVKARKAHQCSHCDGSIAVGELHRSRSDKADGELMSWRWCALCCDAMLQQMAFSGDDLPPPFDARARGEGGRNADQA